MVTVNESQAHYAHQPPTPPNSYFVPCYKKATLLPALAPKVGISCKSWDAEPSNMGLISNDSGQPIQDGAFASAANWTDLILLDVFSFVCISCSLVLNFKVSENLKS